MKAVTNPIVNAQIGGVRFKRRNSMSKYYGVTWSKKEDAWIARFIYSDSQGRKHNKRLGVFKDERDAALAYDKMAIHFNLPTNILKPHVKDPNPQGYGKTD